VVTVETRSSPRQGGEEDRRSWVALEQGEGQLVHMMLKEPQTISMEMPRIAQGGRRGPRYNIDDDQTVTPLDILALSCLYM